MDRTIPFSLAILTALTPGCGAKPATPPAPMTGVAVSDWLPSDEWVIDDRAADGRSEQDLMFDAVLHCVLSGDVLKPHLRNDTGGRVHVVSDRPYVARLPDGWRAANVGADGTPVGSPGVVILRITGANPATTAPVKSDFGTGWRANIDLGTNDPMVFDSMSGSLLARRVPRGWAVKWLIRQS